jgi:hypothetical protein
MSQGLATVARYRFSQDAHLARIKLEGEGIPCALQDEQMGDIYRGVAIGIRLQVAEDQSERAREILRDSDESTAWRCERCGSTHWRPQWSPWVPGFLVAALLSVAPMFSERAKRRCTGCGHVNEPGSERNSREVEG